jgi:hypothetical protein
MLEMCGFVSCDCPNLYEVFAASSVRKEHVCLAGTRDSPPPRPKGEALWDPLTGSQGAEVGQPGPACLSLR